jgi:serpin B
MLRTALLFFLPLASVLSAGEPGITQGLNRFSSTLYERLAKPGEKNLVLSPYSIASALSMALAGARGTTATEISKVLGQPTASPSYHADFAALAASLAKSANTRGNVFLDANRVWIQRDFRILPDFRQLLESTYRAPAAPVDFVRDADSARREINAWTEKQTRGRIRDLFAPGALGADTRLVLTSAVYFYGKWERAFRLGDTRPAPFTIGAGGTVQTDFMNRTGRYAYAETPTGQFLEMRYDGTGLAFDIFLPKPGAALEAPTPERLAMWTGALQDRNVRVSIPKFRVEAEFSLGDTLAAIGMPSAFTRAADFSGINGRRDLAVAKVVHKAFIDVAEEGTEAAAATGIGVSLVSMPVNPDPVFRADRPFVFLIRDTRSGVVLFAGRMMNPKQ